jgi:DNA-binding transcriptional MerR regulator
VSARGLSIGAVLAQLQPEFPDVSISKIRFLEAEGLITPQRTGSGYRSFSPEDVERLRYILTAQRDRFWPLKVIREALGALDRGLTPPGDGSGGARPAVPPAGPGPTLPTPEQLRPRSDLRLTAAELREAAELAGPTFEALSTFGLLRTDGDGHYGEGDLAVARAAGALAAYGVEPRHLRPFRTAADREIGLVQQVVSPLRRRRGSAPAHGTAEDPTTEVLAWCVALHTGLVRSGLASG